MFGRKHGKRFIGKKPSATSPPQHRYQSSPNLFFQRIVGGLFLSDVDDDLVEMMAD